LQSTDQKKFEEVLVSLSVVDKDKLDKAKIESVRSGKDLDSILVSLKYADQEEVTKALAISMNIPYADLTNVHINESVLKLIPKDIAVKYMVAPFGVSGSNINVGMENPNNIPAIEFIERKTSLRVVPYMASDNGIKNVLMQYQDLSSEVDEAIRSIEVTNVDSIKTEKESGGKELGELIQDAPVTRAVNTILEYAIKSRASDIHIEPWGNALKIRYRVDGVLQETMTLPVHIQSALVSRIKILSNLKIDEHRIPQDGRFDVSIDNHEADVRVAISPTVHGEKVVMRILDKSGGVINLENLGVRGRAFELISGGTQKPHGMILSTGPTGSGKTTTLYAILTKINTPAVNIVTLEDPVEYQVAGVNQIQVNSAVGLTFAAGLRSILRQDPDVIMVGEIRDGETADLAVQSALTGHTVLSTLHTNSASGVLPRLLDMDIEPFLIASTVSTVIGQRLVRKLCDKCKSKEKSSPSIAALIKKTVGDILPENAEQLKALGYKSLPKKGSELFDLYTPVGCSVCNNTGYIGRIGIYEVFNMSPEIERLIVGHATTTDIQNQVIKEGMITMRQDGFLKALEGITTIEEVIAKAAEV
jgi:type IV pilus assembly protein PilB